VANKWQQCTVEVFVQYKLAGEIQHSTVNSTLVWYVLHTKNKKKQPESLICIVQI
jgi:hypothetical protein